MTAASEKEEKRSLLSGDVLILLAMAIFGLYAIFIRLFPGVSPLAFLFAFQLVGAASFAIPSLRDPTNISRAKRQVPLLFSLALVAMGSDLLLFLAVRMTSIANATVAHQSVSIFMLFLAPLFAKKKTRKQELVALSISMLGMSLLYYRGLQVGTGKDIAGISLGVLSGLFYALIILLYGLIHSRGVSLTMTSFVRYAISTLLLAPFIPLMGLNSVKPHDLFPLLVFGLTFAVIATAIHTAGITKTRPLHATILGKSEPVFAIVYAVFILGEAPTTEAVVGGVLIAGSSVWLAVRKEKVSGEAPHRSITSEVGHAEKASESAVSP